MRACTVRPCPWTRCRSSTRSGIPRGGHRPEASRTCHTSRHFGRTASRGVLSRRHVPQAAAGAPPAVEVEVLRHQFSALAASDVPACTRVFARTLPACCQCGAVCRISHSSHGYRTWLPLLHRPASAGRCGLPRRKGRSCFPIRAAAVPAGCAPRAATMTALASATGHARTLPTSRTGAGEMMPCSMHFLMLSVLRGFAVRLRPRHAATSPGWEKCPEQADLRVVALMAKTALSSAHSAVWSSSCSRSRSCLSCGLWCSSSSAGGVLSGQHSSPGPAVPRPSWSRLSPGGA